MKKLYLLISAVMIFAATASAQTPDRKWGIGLHANLFEPWTSLGNDFYKFSGVDENSVGAGLSVNRYLGRSFDLGLHMLAGKVKQSNAFFGYDDEFYGANLRFRYKFYNGYILKEEAVIGPYISVGGGGFMTTVDAISPSEGIVQEDISQAGAYGGAGIRFRLSPVISLEVQSGLHYPLDNRWDGNVNGDQDMFLEHSFGLVISVGKGKDTDGDGVADKRDKCADTPMGVKVDEAGCPLDTDNDGVADYQDTCPDAAGRTDLSGCPDRDNDNVADKDDRCPGDAGLANLQGCPDTDNDGVADIDDRCSGTREGYQVDEKGCPFDNDNDAVVNEEDDCIDEPGLAYLRGCPDTDSDGVADRDDKCPDVKGLIANDGCPEMPKEIVKQISSIASKIFFETGSNKLKSTSTAQLDGLVTILGQYPDTKLEIEGHTDNVGSDEYNLQLSQRRTDAVRDYLISKGVEAERLTAIGYGETRPIDDNKTAAGRAANRRVELKTKY